MRITFEGRGRGRCCKKIKFFPSEISKKKTKFNFDVPFRKF